MESRKECNGEEYAVDVEVNTECQSCQKNKGEIKLCHCDHVVCLSCFRNSKRNITTIECPLHGICQMQYPTDVLRTFFCKDLPLPKTGMPSVGTTCYASCILQVLRYTETFVQYLERNIAKKESVSDLLLNILTSEISLEDKKSDISYLLVYLQSMDETFDPNNQNDCVSFLHVLLDVLSRDECVKRKAWHFFIDVVDEIECKVCSLKEATSAQSTLGINTSIDISEINMDNIDGEEMFENGELICNGCKKNRKIVKSTRLMNCPALLLVQIQRIWDTGKGMEKRTLDISFPAVLPIIVAKEEEEDEIMAIYELYAVVYHRGDVKEGHYFCAVRNGNDWYMCDNEDIQKCNSDKEILKFGEGYLLFYERK